MGLESLLLVMFGCRVPHCNDAEMSPQTLNPKSYSTTEGRTEFIGDLPQ